MLKLADLEKEYLVPCARCAKPMPAWELFCPSCNEEQSLPEAAVDASRSAPSEPPNAGASETVAAGPIESVRSRQEEWEPIVQSVSTTAANEEIGFELGEVRPGSTWQDAAPVAGAPLQSEGSSAISVARVTIGVAATLVVLLLFALMHDTFVLRRDGELVKTRDVAANAGPVRAERVLGDPNEVQSKGDAALEVKGAADPSFQDNERKDGLPDATVTAVQALGLGEAGASLVPMPLPSADATVAVPVAATPAADSTDPACTGAHAALALCQKR